MPKPRPKANRQLVKRVTAVETLRYNLPIAHYLNMLHTGACTGHVPRVDPQTGRPTGEYDEINVAQRLDLTKTLLDKTMPTKAPDPEMVDLDAEVDPREALQTNLDMLSTDELLKLADAEIIEDTDDDDDSDRPSFM